MNTLLRVLIIVGYTIFSIAAALFPILYVLIPMRKGNEDWTKFYPRYLRWLLGRK